jgi:hypothetical protein
MHIFSKILSRRANKIAYGSTCKLLVDVADFKHIWNGSINFSPIERDRSVLFNHCLDC